MQRYNANGKLVENPKLDEAIEKIIAVCREHGVSLAHEDKQGCFQFEGPSEKNERWLRVAVDATE